MKRLDLVLLTVAVSTFNFQLSTAQGEGGALTLDLKEAISIALSENPTIKSADMEIERYDYVRRETMGNHLPSLSAAGQYSFNIVKQEMTKGMSLGADMSATATADLSIPLVVPAVYASLKLNRTQQALAVEQARSSRIELVNAVTKNFFQILLLERSYDVLRASESTMAATVEDTRTMFKAGLASEYDVLTAEVQLSNLQPGIINTGNSIEISKQMLKMYLGIPEDIEVTLEGTLEGHMVGVLDIPDPAAALEGNSELRQLDYQQTLVSQQIRLANASRLPVLAGYGSFIASGQDKTIDFASMMTGGGAASTINKWWWQTPFTAGIQLSIPIFSGFKNTNKVKQLRNQVAQIDMQRGYLREAKALEARTAVSSLISARETRYANEKTVAQAEKAYSIARARFDAGAGTMLEVNQAQLNVTSSKLNLSQATYDLLAARADYDKVIGDEGNATQPAPVPAGPAAAPFEYFEPAATTVTAAETVKEEIVTETLATEEIANETVAEAVPEESVAETEEAVVETQNEAREEELPEAQSEIPAEAAQTEGTQVAAVTLEVDHTGVEVKSKADLDREAYKARMKYLRKRYR